MNGIKRSGYRVGISGDIQLPGVSLVSLVADEKIPTGIGVSLTVNHNHNGKITGITSDKVVIHDKGLNTGYATATLDFIADHEGYINTVDFFVGFGGRLYFSEDGLVGVGFGIGYKPNVLGKVLNNINKSPIINVSIGTETSIEGM